MKSIREQYPDITHPIILELLELLPTMPEFLERQRKKREERKAFVEFVFGDVYQELIKFSPFKEMPDKK